MAATMEVAELLMLATIVNVAEVRPSMKKTPGETSKKEVGTGMLVMRWQKEAAVAVVATSIAE